MISLLRKQYSKKVGRFTKNFQVLHFSDDNSGLNRGYEAKGAMSQFLKDVNNNQANKMQSQENDRWAQFRSNLESLSTFSGVSNRTPNTNNQRVFRKDNAFPKKFAQRTHTRQGQKPGTSLRPRPGTSLRDSDRSERKAESREDVEMDILLNSLNHFAGEVKKGRFKPLGTADIDKEYGFDELDRILTNALIGACKTSDHTHVDMLQPDIRKSPLDRVNLPQPRTMGQIMHSLDPQIQGAEKGTYAYETALDVWKAVSKNIYYTEEDKRYFANSTARILTNLIAKAEKLEELERLRPTPIFEPPEINLGDDKDNNADDADADEEFNKTSTQDDSTEIPLPDMYLNAKPEDFEDLLSRDIIFQPGFRKGLNGMLAEIEAKKRRERIAVKIKKQSATDWNQKAVFSEDDL